ncbi:hypothetical protein ACGFZJ_21525 [Streptomyces sp. NPDC048253]|uniref:hypothetical protein n=1 Tax=Streptomyces sp. NPDC048253 TaxID=3365524 RepID=UPI00371E1461
MTARRRWTATGSRPRAGARWGSGDEGKAYGVDGDASDVRREHVIDWLEQASDLPHLIARVSELVLLLGHEPDDLVVLPRSELDRRELAAYSAGWADVVDEQLPAIRRAYEERITAAYLQGQEDARTGHRPRRTRRAEGEREHERGGEVGEVIPLPYVELLRPPSAWTRVEERGERERSVADGTPVPSPSPAAETDGSAEAPYGDPDTANVVGPTSASGPARGPQEEDGEVDGEAGGAGGAEAGSGAEGDILLSAREVRGKRVMPSDRRPVVRRNGRPSVPPLALPGEIGATGRERARRPDGAGTAERPPRERHEQTDRAEQSEQTDDVERPEPVEPVEPVDESVEPQGVREEPRPRLLSDRARALADELQGRAGGRRRDEQNGPSGSR